MGWKRLDSCFHAHNRTAQCLLTVTHQILITFSYKLCTFNIQCLLDNILNFKATLEAVTSRQIADICSDQSNLFIPFVLNLKHDFVLRYKTLCRQNEVRSTCTCNSPNWLKIKLANRRRQEHILVPRA